VTENFSLDRLPVVLEHRGDGHSSLYLDIQRGTWTPPVHLGRASAWPRHEVQALVRARIAGATPEQLRTIVQGLLNQRAAMMPAIAGTDSAPPSQSRQDDLQPAARIAGKPTASARGKPRRQA
jgi:prophage regulatory protein